MTKLNKTDMAILRALQKDARQSHEAIGAQIGRDGSVVSRRVAELVKTKVITGVHAAIDPIKVGLEIAAYKLVSLKGHGTDVTGAFEGAIETMPNVVEWARLGGDWDYLLKLICRDKAEHDQVHHRILSLPTVHRVQLLTVYDMPRTKLPPILEPRD